MKKIISLLLSVILAFSTIQVVFADTNGSMSNFRATKTYTAGQFSDVSTNDWFAENVKTMYELGLINGTSETTFTPDSNLSVVEAITLISRIHDIYYGNNHKFESATPWYQSYLDYAYKTFLNMEGTIDNFSNDPFVPFYGKNYTKDVTRGHFVMYLYWALPYEEINAINNISNGSIPDVEETEDYNAIYAFYNAGIVSGNDEYGTFNQYDPIKRSEVAAIITRVVDKTQRKIFSLKQKPIEVESVSLNKTAISLTAGEKESLKVTILPDNATDKNITYTSSNPSVASVSNNGEIKALTQGNSTITATSSNGKTAQCNVSVAAAPIEFRGSGDKVINNVDIPFGSYYAELTHDGDRNFISKLYYGEKSYDYFLLSNEIGACSLQFALNENANAAINNGMLEVKADGSWTIKIKPVTGTTTTNIKGSGQIVTGLFTAKSSRVAVNLSHSGERNFIVKVIKYNGTKSYDYELLANEIGNYIGQKVVQLTPGTQYYFYVRADGNWTIDFGEGDSVTTYSAPKVSTSNRNNNNENDYDYDDSNDGEDKKFSYTDAKNLNTYAAAATKACNNATSEALNAYKKPAMASIYVAKALNYASTAKSNMKNAIKLLEGKADLTYTDGSTVLENAKEALDAINDILDFDAENGDIIKLQTLCSNAAVKSIKVQKASVDLMGAFVD